MRRLLQQSGVAFGLAAISLQMANSAQPFAQPQEVIRSDVIGKMTISAQEWRTPEPQNTVYLELSNGRVIIELLPEIAPAHVNNLRLLIRERYYDRMPIVRVQDNYVVQWNAISETAPLRDAQKFLAPEFTSQYRFGKNFQRWPYADGFAPEAGQIHGFPAARDPKSGRTWLTHCYGMLGAGRDDDAGSGGGRELYVVIGHAPRHLDQNVTLFGRVIDGIERLSGLPRGHGEQGYFLSGEAMPEIMSVRLASDLPIAERSHLQILRTDSVSYRKLLAAKAQAAGYLDLCHAPLVVRRR